jgi:hypothetical protein
MTASWKTKTSIVGAVAAALALSMMGCADVSPTTPAGSKSDSVSASADAGAAGGHDLRSSGRNGAANAPAPVGDDGVIATGLQASEVGEWVIVGGARGIRPTFTLKERTQGKLDTFLEIYDPGKEPLKPGFHAVEGAYNLEGNVVQPSFGYYIGEDVSIEGIVGKMRVPAHFAKWDEERAVIVFWFDTEVSPTKVVARSVSGRVLSEQKVTVVGP